jgi:protein involved in polysaccharide export with SLBB domain
MPANAKNGAATGNPLASITEVINEAKKYQPMGRVSIHLDENVTKLQESEYNLVLQNNDTLIIPSQIDTVTVFGEVFNPTSFVYKDGLDAQDYIKLASGFARGADEDRVYVIHADGTSEPAVSGWWIFSSYATVQKGDTVVVPMYIKEYNQLDLWESVSKIMASFAITAATLQTIGVF